MPVIEIEEGPGRGKRIRLPDRGTVLIGRDEKCPLRLDDPSVAPRHCILKSDGGPWRLLAGKAGAPVAVNGRDAAERELADGDLLRIGTAVLSFQVPEADPLVGTEIGGHRIVRRLGRNPAGITYLAVHGKLRRPVSLKVFDGGSADADPARARLLDEELGRALKLSHPNLASVYDAGTDGGRRFVVTEHVDGGSLGKVLMLRGRLPPEAAAGIGIDVLGALEYAEGQVVVHGHIGPGTILLSRDGSANGVTSASRGWPSSFADKMASPNSIGQSIATVSSARFRFV